GDAETATGAGPATRAPVSFPATTAPVSSPAMSSDPAQSEGASTGGDAPATTAGAAQQPRTPTGKQGKATDVVFGDNTLRITVGKASWQGAAKWGSTGAAEHGYFVVPITVLRTDHADHVNQISWGDWSLRTGS